MFTIACQQLTTEGECTTTIIASNITKSSGRSLFVVITVCGTKVSFGHISDDRDFITGISLKAVIVWCDRYVITTAVLEKSGSMITATRLVARTKLLRWCSDWKAGGAAKP